MLNTQRINAFMKIIIAMDSLKGSVSASLACDIIRDSLLAVHRDLSIVVIPMADGGEGTAKTLLKIRDGEWVSHNVMGPLPIQTVEAGYAWFENRAEALVEMASASGTTLLKPEELNPFNTTTYGTGQLVGHALERELQKLLLAVGGSATVDGGVGMAMALGWQFLDIHGNAIGYGGRHLEQIATIIPSENPGAPAVEVLCDVDNPLCGKTGAAHIFGPQKGATPDMVDQLDAGLHHLADCVEKERGKKIDIPGAGAAGGLAAGAMAFLDAELVSGIETIISVNGLKDEIQNADWIITGEGRFDAQSLHGKVVSGIVNLAQETKTQVAIIAGSTQISEQQYKQWGIEIVLSCQKEDMTTEYAIEHSETLLRNTTRDLAEHYLKLP